jgi:protein phosphatase
MLEAFGLSDPGCVRKNNEDYYFVDSAMGLFLLADGMGGAQAGETASRLAVETVVDFVRKNDGGRDVATLIGAFEEANRAVLETASGAAHLNGMGTTLVGVMECGDHLVVASVGDSRVYLYDSDTLQPITEDQTWAHEVGRKLGLDSDKMKTHPMRHVLTMAIGVNTPLRIHSYKVEAGAGVQILLCSDGLHGVVGSENITEGLRKVGDLETKCHYLIEAARQAGGPDNITAVLLRKRD